MALHCEHVIARARNVAASIVESCPHVRILSTSREALGIAGETPWRVPSLSLPPEPLTLNHQLSTLTQYDAVRLSIDRAVTLVPAFMVTNQNAPAVANPQSVRPLPGRRSGRVGGADRATSAAAPV